MKKCKICGKELTGRQKVYCSIQCSAKGLNRKSNRKTKLTKELTDKICKYIRAGNYIETACKAVGISLSTYYEWFKKGDIEKIHPYLEFSKAIKKAESEGEISLELEIRRDSNWQSKAWLLERRHPERWGRKDRINLEHKGGVEVKINVGDKVRKILGNTELTKIVNAIIAEQGGEEFFEESSGESESEIPGDVCE